MAEKAPEYKKDLYQLKLQVLDLAKNAGIEVPEEIEESKADVNGFITHASDFLSEIVSAFSNFIMVLLLIVFVVIDATTLRQKYDQGEISPGSSLAHLSELVRSIRKYLSIAALTGFYTAAGNLVLLLILGVEYAVLWAFLSFLFSFIPNIGFVLSVIGPALLALFEIGPVSAIIVVVGFILINEFIENVVKPRMMGKDLDLSLTVVFLSLIVWAFILGPMGTILAIPMTLVGKMAWTVYVKEEKS
jgi:predicted PurR-regulated permease PerM